MTGIIMVLMLLFQTYEFAVPAMPGEAGIRMLPGVNRLQTSPAPAAGSKTIGFAAYIYTNGN